MKILEDQGKKGIVIFLLVLFLYITDIPALGIAAKLVVYLFLLGFFIRKELKLQGNEITESIFLSVLGTVCFGLILGNMVFVADLISRIAVITILAGLFVKQDMQLQLPKIGTTVRDYTLIFLIGGIPFILIFILNPTYSLISDGWWQCSILNTIDQGKLPPANPWSVQSTLAYPYAYHILIKYAIGKLDCFASFNLFALITTWLTMIAIYEIAKGIYKNRTTAIIAGLSFILISHTGGIAFLYDMLIKLPQLGVSGYLEFLKTIHGPHQYYGTMAFMKSLVITPMQMATMMNSIHFMGLAFLLYFLSKKNTLAIGGSLALLVVANPIIAVVGGLTTLLYFTMTKRKEEVIKDLLIIAGICLLVGFNYFLAIITKTSVVSESLLAKGNASFWPGYFAAYIPLIIISMTFFNRYDKCEEIYLLLAFALAAFVGAVVLAKGPAYLATDFVIFYSICCAFFFADILKDWRKSLPQIALVCLLMIPTFLVVGSYSYYKIPLSQDELAASNWIKENTKEQTVFLATINLQNKSNLTASQINTSNLTANLPPKIDIHQYVPVFGKRYLYFGDPYLLYVYGEDYSRGMMTHQKIFAERKVCEGLNNTIIDYVYVDQKKLYLQEPLPKCVKEVYRNSKVRIYGVIS